MSLSRASQAKKGWTCIVAEAFTDGFAWWCSRLLSNQNLQMHPFPSLLLIWPSIFLLFRPSSLEKVMTCLKRDREKNAVSHNVHIITELELFLPPAKQQHHQKTNAGEGQTAGENERKKRGGALTIQVVVLLNALHCLHLNNQLLQPDNYLNLIGCFIGKDHRHKEKTGKMRMQKNIPGAVCLLIDNVASHLKDML